MVVAGPAGAQRRAGHDVGAEVERLPAVVIADELERVRSLRAEIDDGRELVAVGDVDGITLGARVAVLDAAAAFSVLPVESRGTAARPACRRTVLSRRAGRCRRSLALDDRRSTQGV